MPHFFLPRFPRKKMTMPENTAFDLPGYKSAIDGAAFYLLPNLGCLHLSGPDRIGFLQRQTTNDLDLLSPGRALVTALTSPTARILDLLTLYMEDETVIGALTLPGNAALTAAYLQSCIFFTDNVSVSDASTEFAQIELLGPEAGRTMIALGFSTLPEKNQISTSDLAGIAVQAILTDGFAVRLLVPVEGINSVFATLKGTGALPL